MLNNHRPPPNRHKFATIWGELDYLCSKIHYWWHVKNVRSSARRYLHRLERVLIKAPANDQAIIRAEGLALLHELKDDNDSAIKYRQREIQLIERLHDDVRKSVRAGDYDARMAASILATHDAKALQERRKILQSLKKEEAAQVAC